MARAGRRAFLAETTLAVASGVLGAGAVACGRARDPRDPAVAGEPFDCHGTGDLDARQQQMRRVLEYTDESPRPGELCANCRFWHLAKPGQQCGGCKLVPGPIHPKGWCVSWAPPKEEG